MSEKQDPVTGKELMVRSQAIDRSEVMEYIVDGLIDEMGKMPTKYFDGTVLVTVIVEPLPDLPDEEIRK